MKQKKIDDINVMALRQLTRPIDLIKKIPLTDRTIKNVTATRENVRQIIHGLDDRLLIVVGPCSIHNSKAALEYGDLLKELAQSLQNELCIVMRTYFEKPRTNVGWKGFINDPDLDGGFDINKGLFVTRKLLLDLNNRGIPTGTEFLETITPQFISDLISWGAIGARTTESQVHRELASGLSMPIGFKNGTTGNTGIAVDAIYTANHPHCFLSVTKSGMAAIVSTKGNNNCHIILRGGNDKTNYDLESIKKIVAELKSRKLLPRVMVDCSHGNSKKQFKYQSIVAKELCSQISFGSHSIFGIMLESHLTAGKQYFKVGMKPTYNQSITDGCIAWDETKSILQQFAEAVQLRRQKQGAL